MCSNSLIYRKVQSDGNLLVGFFFVIILFLREVIPSTLSFTQTCEKTIKNFIPK
jgi:hypothetical protein